MPFEHAELVAVALKFTGLVPVEPFFGLVTVMTGVVANNRPCAHRTDVINQRSEQSFPLIHTSLHSGWAELLADLSFGFRRKEDIRASGLE